MLDKETRARIADYFEGPDLVDYLRIPSEEIVDAFEDEIEEVLDELEEFIGVRERLVER